MPRDESNRRVVQPEGGRLMTKQSQALETDVNQIVARHIATKTPLPTGPLQYGDFTNAMDFHGALTRIREAELQFNRLPAHIRRHCNNDPGQYLDLVFDPDRVGELELLGLVDAQKPEAAQPAPVPAPAPAPAPPAPGGPEPDA